MSSMERRRRAGVAVATVTSSASTFLLTILLFVVLPKTSTSFQLKNIFSGFAKATSSTLTLPGIDETSKAVKTARSELLETISNTENGKEAELSTQIKVLGLIDYLETNAPVSRTLLTDPNEYEAIDGRWFLQYTQPSEPEGVDLENDIEPWTPAESTLSTTNRLDTRRANNEGSVSFLGVVKVDTSSKLTTQTIGVEERSFANAVKQDFGTIEVKGTFEFDSVPNRIVAAFDTGTLTLNNGFILDFSFLFAARAILKGGLKAGGWLETTYIDDDIRIGRGNRGSLFVLTRNQDTVTA
eukprot:CAMPEP_0116143602 /NCGR_PEP_ID=MMETSP0329-20121206/15541_1 /TAXON_ID=697910 /ORGANISM="Pseudo-nitzschia arenysensis, Strain B593" /LENGTH=297 /DNA_ID=CAMNT_0003638939 /DNA_START=51 /DNA_END=944 /DNA_ORIENTATION=+